CDTGLAGSQNAADFAKAIGLCHGEVLSAQFINSNGGFTAAFQGARALVTQKGPNPPPQHLKPPPEGAAMVLRSSGEQGNNSHDFGTEFDADNNTATSSSIANPDLTVTQGCGADFHTKTTCTVAGPGLVADQAECGVTNIGGTLFQNSCDTGVRKCVSFCDA